MVEARKEAAKVSFQLTEEQSILQANVRRFAQEEVKPWALGKEWLPEHKDRWPVKLVEKAYDLGLKWLTLPESYGGYGSTFEWALVEEELGAADTSFAMWLVVTIRQARVVASLGSEEQKERFFREYKSNRTFTCAGAMTEPSHGSDTLFPSESIRLDTVAKFDSTRNEWVINGQKMFVGFGVEANYFTIYACTDPSMPLVQGTSAFLVPRDTPGLTIGKPLQKFGRRIASNVPLYFNDMRVPKDCLLGSVNGARKTPPNVILPTHVAAAACTLGNARGAYESALRYAKTRVQGGKTIIEHQMVAAEMAECALLVEAIRGVVWKAAWACDQLPLDWIKYARMAKYMASEYGLKVCENAIQVFGGYGSLLDMDIQKYVREAFIQLHGEGTQDMNLLELARNL